MTTPVSVHHTPGPWHYDDDHATVESDRGVSVAGIDVDNMDYEANVQLIVAAPDMYGALKAIRALFHRSYPALLETAAGKSLRSAIAKVEAPQ